jgi:hypothetical protein
MTPNAFGIALPAAQVSLPAYWAGSYLARWVQGSEPQIGALCATISGVVELQATPRETVASSKPTLPFLKRYSIHLIYLFHFQQHGVVIGVGSKMLRSGTRPTARSPVIR